MCRARLATVTYRLDQIERELGLEPNGPAYWKSDLRAQREAIHRSIATQRFWYGHDLYTADAPQEAAELMQGAVARFGRLLAAWPVIFAAAKRLRASGARFYDRA